MTFPTEPIRPPLVEPTLPARPIVRRQREERNDQRRHERPPEREHPPSDDEDGDGHVDIRV